VKCVYIATFGQLQTVSGKALGHFGTMKNVTTLFFILFASCTRQSDNFKGRIDTDSTTGLIIKDEQTIARLNKLNFIKEHTLVDNELRMKFVLDSQRINISAYDFSNKLMWQTDPWLDNKLIAYQVKRPVLVHFAFRPNWGTDDKEVIWISYNNTQFGTVDRRTGKFHYMGKD
jgi:hypothetical protein